MKETPEQIPNDRQQHPTEACAGELCESASTAANDGCAVVVVSGFIAEQETEFWSDWWAHEITHPVLVGHQMSSDPQLPQAPSREQTPDAPAAPSSLEADAEETPTRQEQRRANAVKNAAHKRHQAEQAKPKPIKPSPKRQALAERLTLLGVAPQKAERLAAIKSAAAIERAVEALSLVYDVKNPGGWLWEALTSGRYDAEPAPQSEAEKVSEQENLERLRREAARGNSPARRSQERDRELELRRQREAQQEAAARERLTAEMSCELALLEALSAEQRTALRVEVLASLGKRAQTMPDGVILGHMLDLLKRRRE